MPRNSPASVSQSATLRMILAVRDEWWTTPQLHTKSNRCRNSGRGCSASHRSKLHSRPLIPNRSLVRATATSVMSIDSGAGSRHQLGVEARAGSNLQYLAFGEPCVGDEAIE